MKKAFRLLITLLILTVGCQPAPAPTLTPTPLLPTATLTPTLPPTATQTTTATLTSTLPPTATPQLFDPPIVVDGDWRITGIDVPALVSFDNTLKTYMQEHGISLGALAVTYKGRLIMAHGYTWKDSNFTTQPVSLFRIASVSKPITAVAVLKLIQDGKLSLDMHITDILTFDPPSGKSVDPRLNDVTVAHLLYHQGGWDIEQLEYDPMFSDFRISGTLGVSLPISQADIITYMSGVPLSFDPGTKYAYSNYGYMLLGRIIEAVSKQSYETYVKDNVLEPLGMMHTQLGRTLPENRLPGEVTYHSDWNSTSVFDGKSSVPWPDGGWNLENMASHGGWVSTVIDMARFEASFDLPQNNPVLTQSEIKLMFKSPPGTTGERYYAMGWDIVQSGGNQMNTWHTGSLDGTLSIMVRRSDGVDWCVVFNERESISDPNGDSYWEIDELLHNAANAVKIWPSHDLFQQLP
jgi:CubicO group peptidase (beta-lactamase class C family)